MDATNRILLSVVGLAMLGLAVSAISFGAWPVLRGAAIWFGIGG